MSVDVVEEIPQEAKHAADCYGTYDERYNECTGVCLIRDKCRKVTIDSRRSPQPKVAVMEEQEPPEDSPAPDMDPFDYFVMLCESSFKMNWKENDSVKVTRVKKDGKTVGEINVVKSSGKIAIIPKSGGGVKLPTGLSDLVQSKALYQLLVGMV